MDKKIPIEEVIDFPEEKDYLKMNFSKVDQLVTESFQQITKVYKKPFLVLMTGGAASGKSTLTRQIGNYLEKNQQRTTIISTDSYYSYSPLLFQSRNPILHQIFQWKELSKDLETLLAGSPICLPVYDNSAERKFIRSTVILNSASIIIVEGLLTLFKEEIREKSDLKIYLEVAEAVRLERRLERYKKGLVEGKFQRPIEYEIERFYKGCPKENQETYVEPIKKYADLVVNNDSFENAVEKIVEVIHERLKKGKI